MPTHQFGVDPLTEWNGKSFVALGNKNDQLSDQSKNDLQSKLSRKFGANHPDIWGTLGWREQEHFDVTGSVTYSKSFNDNSSGPTLDEIENIYNINPLSENPDFLVKERYINFDETHFNFSRQEFSYDDIPELRLTLFVEKGEGALVYYEHGLKGEHNEKEAMVDYILPQQTDKEYSTNRDRLDYFFPILSYNTTELSADEKTLRLTDKQMPTSFVVKVLTFKRKPSESNDFLKEVTTAINSLVKKDYAALGGQVADTVLDKSTHYLGSKKYQLLRYDRTQNAFLSTKGEELDTSKKTLLLVHGTFSSTAGSYGELYSAGNNLLDDLLDNDCFEQIIGFDHPTISHDVFQNATQLYQYLNGVHFEHPVSVLGYSRGALLAKWLGSDPLNNHFEVDKVMTFSGANGVGYFEKAKYVSKGLSALKKMLPSTIGKLITAIAQYSVNYFLNMPGCLQMTPGKPRLTKVLNATQVNPAISYQAVAADWNRSLQPKWYKRWIAMGVDAIIMLILGRKHDWVVGFKEQQITPSSHSKPAISITSMHTKNFVPGYPKPDTRTLITNYFCLED